MSCYVRTLTVPTRWTHTSPSFAYLKEWKKHRVNYVQKLDRPHMAASPQLVSQILRTEAAMKKRGFVPFVHAMPASAKVLLALYNAASPPKKPFVKRLRSPFDRSVKSLAELRAPKEEDRIPRPEFLSVSYALTSNIEPLESAASWGFVNHFGNEQFDAMARNLDNMAAQMEEHTGRKVPDSFVRRGNELIRGYNRLKVGNFYVLGVPPSKLSSWMYDTKAYYVPTGKEVGDVVASPKTTRETGTTAIMKLAKEVLDPNSGLIAVEASNPLEVEQFVYGVPLKSPKELPLYRTILSQEDTSFEESENQMREGLDRELNAYTADVCRWLHGAPSLEYDPNQDFAPLLP